MKYIFICILGYLFFNNFIKPFAIAASNDDDEPKKEKDEYIDYEEID